MHDTDRLRQIPFSNEITVSRRELVQLIQVSMSVGWAWNDARLHRLSEQARRNALIAQEKANLASQHAQAVRAKCSLFCKEG